MEAFSAHKAPEPIVRWCSQPDHWFSQSGKVVPRDRLGASHSLQADSTSILATTDVQAFDPKNASEQWGLYLKSWVPPPPLRENPVAARASSENRPLPQGAEQPKEVMSFQVPHAGASSQDLRNEGGRSEIQPLPSVSEKNFPLQRMLQPSHEPQSLHSSPEGINTYDNVDKNRPAAVENFPQKSALERVRVKPNLKKILGKFLRRKATKEQLVTFRGVETPEGNHEPIDVWEKEWRDERRVSILKRPAYLRSPLLQETVAVNDVRKKLQDLDAESTRRVEEARNAQIAAKAALKEAYAELRGPGKAIINTRIEMKESAASVQDGEKQQEIQKKMDAAYRDRENPEQVARLREKAYNAKNRYDYTKAWETRVLNDRMALDARLDDLWGKHTRALYALDRAQRATGEISQRERNLRKHTQNYVSQAQAVLDTIRTREEMRSGVWTFRRPTRPALGIGSAKTIS